MLKKQISKLALIIASILFIQPYLSVVATLTVSATTTVEITDVVNHESMNQAGITIGQTATKLSENQLEVMTTLVSEQPLAELLLKQTVSNQFTVLRESMKITGADVPQALSQVGADVPITLASEPIAPLAEGEAASFALGGSGQNLVLYGKALSAGTTYTMTTLYELAAGAVQGETLLLTPTALDYRLYESPDLPTTLDFSTLSPRVTLSEVAPPVEETPEVAPPVEETPEVAPPVEETPGESTIIEKPGEAIVEPGTTVNQLSRTHQSLMQSRVAQEEILEIDKTATKAGDEFVIELTANGNPTIIPPTKSDIVIIVDESGSMAGTNLASLQTAAKLFFDKLLIPETDVQISLVEFSTTAQITQDWIGKSGDNYDTTLTTLRGKIDALGAGGGTNTQDAYIKAEQLLKTARNDASKYVVLFTDGFPTFYNQPCEPDTDNPWLGSLGVCGPGSSTNPLTISKAIGAYDQLVNNHPNVNAYSIGLFTSGTTNDVLTLAKEFLFRVQNKVTTNVTDYAEQYFTSDPNSLSTIFENLAQTIIGEIFADFAFNTYLSDVLTKEFKLADNPNFRYVDKNDVEQPFVEVASNVDLGLHQVKRLKVQCNSIEAITSDPDDCDKVEFKLGTMNHDMKVRFNIVPRDPYYGNVIVATNIQAEIAYQDVINEADHIQVFPIPKVNLPFVEGTVTVIKDVTNFDTDQKFSIEIFGPGQPNNNQKFGFEVGETASETMSFYMKAPTTDITPNTDYSKNYVTIGEFNIAEYVPQNYKLVRLEYHYGDNNWVTYNGNNPFTIDKDHRAVYIRVTNEVTNTDYWYDSAEVENMFPFTFMNQEPTALSFGKEEDVA